MRRIFRLNIINMCSLIIDLGYILYYNFFKEKHSNFDFKMTLNIIPLIK